MEDELDCDFYFGDIEKGKIIKLDYSLFNKPIVNLKTIRLIYHLNWIKGSVSLLFKPYKKYILVGEPWCLSTWVILFLSKLTSKQVYLWTHGWYGDEGKTKTLLKKVFFCLAKGIFLYGNYAKDLMIKSGFNSQKLHVIYNSLDYEKQLEIRNKLFVRNIYSNYFENEFPVVVFIGRLTGAKKLDLLLESQNRLYGNGVRFNLFFLGDGSERKKLEEQVRLLELEKYVCFYGACYDDETIGQFLFEADLCVSPGNVGLTAIHSFMYGCPVITHNDFTQQMPEFEVVEKGITGDFFVKGSVDSLSNVIQNWLAIHRNDKEVIKNACFRMIDEKYNPNYQINVLKRVLTEL